jgi:predicted transcriptional regulator
MDTYALSLRKVRVELDLSQDDLASWSGTTKISVWRIETGRRFPKPETVEQHIAGLRSASGTFTTELEQLLRDAYSAEIRRRAQKRLIESRP